MLKIKFNILALALLYFYLLNVPAGHSQNTVGVLYNSAEASNGYTLFTNYTKTYLINNCGEVINEWNSDYIDGKSVYLLEDGSILRAGVLENTSFTLPGIGGVIQKFDWNGNLNWEYTYSTSSFVQHHDVYPLSNGNVLILAVTKKTGAEAIQAGRDPSLLADNELYNEQILEVQPTGLNTGNIVWEWNVWDHLIQDFDNTKDNYGVVSDNPQLLNINYLGISSAGNWMHCNSIQYDENLDVIVLSSRQLNEIYIIDHSTTSSEAASHLGGSHNKGGDILYRWGNPKAYGLGTSSDQKLFGQHTPHIIPTTYPDGSKILIFNNGDVRPAPLTNVSTIEIIAPAMDENDFYIRSPGQSFGPNLPDWVYQDPIPTDFFSRIMGSAQRLPNGNTLICDSGSGYFFEIDSNNQKVWEYINPLKTNGDIISQGDNPAGNITFRAFKYSPNYSAFIGKDLTPGDPIELNSELNAPCNVLQVEDYVFYDLLVYPNPAQNRITIRTRNSIDRIEFYNYLGNKIEDFQCSNQLDISKYSSGMYFLKVYSKNSSTTKKIIKL